MWEILILALIASIGVLAVIRKCVKEWDSADMEQIKRNREVMRIEGKLERTGKRNGKTKEK